MGGKLLKERLLRGAQLSNDQGSRSICLCSAASSEAVLISRMALSDILAAAPRVQGSLPDGPINWAINDVAAAAGASRDLSRAAGRAAACSVDWEAGVERSSLPGGVMVAQHYATAVSGLLQALLDAQEFVRSRASVIPLCEGIPVTGGHSQILFRFLHALSEAEKASAALHALVERPGSSVMPPFKRMENMVNSACSRAGEGLDVLERDRMAFERVTQTQMIGQVEGVW